MQRMLAMSALLVGTVALHAGSASDASVNGAQVETVAAPGPALRMRFRTVTVGSEALRLLATVERHADNRRLRVVVDSGTFYRSSEIQIDGMQAPRNYELRWQSFPPGAYCIEATLVRATGEFLTSRRSYRVVGLEMVAAASLVLGRARIAPFARPAGRTAPGIAHADVPMNGCDAYEG
jgi:hypothetical protein